MSSDHDVVLLETVKTHRSRLRAAFLFGELSERRVANDNVRRVIGSMVLAAVLCASCIGVSFVVDLLQQRAAAAQTQIVQTPTPAPSTPATPAEVDTP
ncbi:hypothetical protein GY21_07640 [Cryobacterium roopkundense]|uniref:Uncharacterized protein n=1 Tax=Cryobacterium roopkundense TaxID=1001240 RepID=A0A099JHE7_9MICO|nr:hypothetical protein [Cryobacterium roopkundense]KGJ77495.1 hypothetical protein GY21_07640 [Cryobacterium roopkundense]MBB5642550.1 hypothetical protein [Cryobacterium roopkundense]